MQEMAKEKMFGEMIEVMRNGNKSKFSTSFPSDWTRQEVVKKILEAKKHIQECKIPFEKQLNKESYQAIGYTKERMKIFFAKNNEGTIVTIYPLIK